MNKNIIFVCLKILILFISVAYINKHINVETLFFTLKKVRLFPLFLCLIIILIQLLLTSYRWKKIAENLNSNLGYLIVLKIFWIGHFFSQFLPSSIGGDIIRVWMTSKHKISTLKSLSITLCDRFFGLLANIVIPIMTYLALNETVNIYIRNTIAIYTIFIFILILFLIVYKRIFKSFLRRYQFLKRINILIDDLEVMLTKPKTTIHITMLSILIQLGHVIMIYLISFSVGANLKFLYSLLLIPTILLVSMLPISYGGWGLREGAMIVGLGFFSIAKEDALTISIIFGFMQIISSIPGLLLWLRNKQH